MHSPSLDFSATGRREKRSDWHGAPDPQRRGIGGEVFVQPAPDPSPIAFAYLNAAESLGIARYADQNGVMQEGVRSET